jgi:hypothetical protein
MYIHTPIITGTLAQGVLFVFLFFRFTEESVTRSDMRGHVTTYKDRKGSLQEAQH